MKRDNNKKTQKLVGVSGWLAWAVVGLLFGICLNFYNSISGFSDNSWNIPAMVNAYPGLPALIAVENTAQLLFALSGLVLVVMIFKKSQQARLTAILFFSILLLFNIIDVSVAENMFSNNQAALNAINSSSGINSIWRDIFYSIIWLLYFTFSRRVKNTLSPSAITNEPAASKLSPEMSKKIAILERIALKLDQGCRDGELSTDTINKAQRYLNEVSGSIIDSKRVGYRAYIVYEVQAIIHWAQDEYEDASALAKSAIQIKGDKILLTETANKILRR